MKNNRGFTLVELAIVLVIIGLLIGGILVARSMVETATLTKVVKDLEQYEIAVQQFRGVYKYLPGDCPNCGQFFGDNCAADMGASRCNGNGNGQVEHNYVNEEQNRVFEHLFLGGFLKTEYHPVHDYHYNPGVSNPAASINDVTDTNPDGYDNKTVTIILSYHDPYPPEGNYADTPVANPGNYFLIARGENVKGTNGSMKPSLALALDRKLDDGIPLNGTVRGKNESGLCIPAYDFVPCLRGNSGQYTNTSNDKTCNVYVKLRDPQ